MLISCAALLATGFETNPQSVLQRSHLLFLHVVSVQGKGKRRRVRKAPRSPRRKGDGSHGTGDCEKGEGPWIISREKEHTGGLFITVT